MKATTKLLIAAMLAAGLAGCGDSDEAAPEGADAPSSTTTTAASSTTSSAAAGEGASATEGEGGSTATEGGGASSTSAAPSFTGEGSEAFCTMSAEFDLENAFTDAETPEQLETSFEQVVSALDQMADEAPAEIRDDVTAVSEAWQGLREPLEEAGWNLSQVDPEVFNTPDAEQLEASADRLDAYMSDVCGIEPAESEG